MHEKYLVEELWSRGFRSESLREDKEVKKVLFLRHSMFIEAVEVEGAGFFFFFNYCEDF